MITRKKIAYSLIGVAVIVVPLTYYFIAPRFTVRITNETLEELGQVEKLREGYFFGENGRDAKGTVSLLQQGDQYYLRFEDNFRMTNGPELFVFFGRDGEYDPSAQIGKLKGNVGGQNYAVPAAVHPGRYIEVWIRSKALGSAFAKAEFLP